MMKKLLLTIVFAIAGIILVNAQCIPDSTCGNLVCPDTATNLPHVASIAMYSTTMTVKVPADTTVPIVGTVPIDSLCYTSVTGLPFGFTMKPNKTGWKGGTRGCVEISGSPADSMRGKTYQLVIYTTAHALSGSASVPIPLSGYRIVMDSTLGISTFESNDFSLEQNTPNPFSLATFINFTSPSQENCQFTVYNILGAVVYCQSIVAKTGKNAILFSAASLPSGIYLYKLSNATQTITRRMIVEGR